MRRSEENSTMQTSDVLREVNTKGAVLTWDPRGFIRKVTKPGAEYTLEDAEEDFNVAKDLGGGQPRPLLVDERGLKAAEPAVRSFWSRKEVASVFKCVAIVAGTNPVNDMIANFAISVSRPVVPTKLFPSEAAAMPWVEWFLDDGHDSPPPSIKFR
jgi:hypothetical protein